MQPAQAGFVLFVAAISIAGSIFPEGKLHRSIRFDSFFSRPGKIRRSIRFNSFF
jgi:hypothetical protein